MPSVIIPRFHCLPAGSIGQDSTWPHWSLPTNFNAVLADPKAKARFAELGASLLPGSPADFGNLVLDETRKWAKVVKDSGAKAE